MNKIIVLLSLVLFAISSSAQVKVVDKSGKKPKWINAMKSGYIISSGNATNLEEAKEQAFLRVKEQINSSVADHVKTKTNWQSEEITANNVSSLYDKFNSVTTTQTGKRDFLHGISPNKVESYYWEKIKDKDTKKESYVYHILYPLSNSEVMKLVNEFKKKDAELTTEMHKCLNELNNYTSYEDIKQSVSQLTKLNEIFIDERHTKCATAIEKGKALINSIYLIDMGSTLGEVKYSLQIGNKTVPTAMKPRVKTNCARITQKDFGKHICKIRYEYDECYDEPGNNIKVTYRIGNRNLEKEFVFDISTSQVEIMVNGLLRIKDGKLLIPIMSKTSTSFTVNKVILDFEDGTSTVVAPMQSYSGEGQHQLSVQLENSSLPNTTQTVQNVNGSIYFSNSATGDTQSIRLYKKDIKIE